MNHNVGHALGLLWIPAGFFLIVAPIMALFMLI